jgi:hypothetical protein
MQLKQRPKQRILGVLAMSLVNWSFALLAGVLGLIFDGFTHKGAH